MSSNCDTRDKHPSASDIGKFSSSSHKVCANEASLLSDSTIDSQEPEWLLQNYQPITVNRLVLRQPNNLDISAKTLSDVPSSTHGAVHRELLPLLLSAPCSNENASTLTPYSDMSSDDIAYESDQAPSETEGCFVEQNPVSSQRDIVHTDSSHTPTLIRGKSFTGQEEDLEHEPERRKSCDPRLDFLSVCHKAADQAEELVHRVWEAGWRVVHHRTLPKWLKDNDFLIKGHRLPTYSFAECFRSVFRIHTETGNIWTHLLGFIAFVAMTLYFLTRPSIEIQLQEKAVFSPFFFGAILCLGFSTLFHTLYCHSEKVGKLFNKLDYCGISLLTMGSFVPWLYYSFYCRLKPKITYLILIFILGTCSIVVSLWDKFSTPQFRSLRAGVFIALGLSGIIPAIHYIITDGFYHAFAFASLGWLILMAFLYIAGAIIYAVRIPERLFPGKFDIWFQSHQIFHVFVVAAAFVHYHGISRIAMYRLSSGDCLTTE